MNYGFIEYLAINSVERSWTKSGFIEYGFVCECCTIDTQDLGEESDRISLIIVCLIIFYIWFFFYNFFRHPLLLSHIYPNNVVDDTRTRLNGVRAEVQWLEALLELQEKQLHDAQVAIHQDVLDE